MVEVGSRATLYDGEPCIVTGRAFWLAGWWWRVVVPTSSGGWANRLVIESSLSEVEAPPVFEVGARVVTLAGHAGTVIERGIRDGRAVYGVLILRIGKSGVRFDGLAYYRPEQLNNPSKEKAA